ncbi:MULTISPECIES: hypothetical protein [Brasilonema]|uniref:hypothetical protein n=1 Tax=Brasilonema TaxID=383614 RepID=UPI001B7D14AA|nr:MULTISPECIES: hypothetical protein [Brasilonema]
MTQNNSRIQGKFYPLQHEEWLRANWELKPAEVDVLYYLKTVNRIGERISIPCSVIASDLKRVEERQRAGGRRQKEQSDGDSNPNRLKTTPDASSRETRLRRWLPCRRWGFIPSWLQPESLLKDIIYTFWHARCFMPGNPFSSRLRRVSLPQRCFTPALAPLLSAFCLPPKADKSTVSRAILALKEKNWLPEWFEVQFREQDKDISDWKEALDKILAYSAFFPEHSKRIHLFGRTDLAKLALASATCEEFNVVVTFEEVKP